MAAALGHLQLEETSSAMEGLLSFYLHCLGSTSMWQDLCNSMVSVRLSVCLSVCLFRLSTTAAACSRFAAVGPSAGDIDQLLYGTSAAGNPYLQQHGRQQMRAVSCCQLT